LPPIAEENLNSKQGAYYILQPLRDAGFTHTEIIPTDGKPGVFATLDAGAPKTLGVYFMYDVKQFDPAEWSSPPLEGRIVDKPGLGKVMMGRGAVNQKGPEAAFLAALHAIKASGQKLPVNLVLVAEGEEEIGSVHNNQIVRTPKVPAPPLAPKKTIVVACGGADAAGRPAVRVIPSSRASLAGGQVKNSLAPARIDWRMASGFESRSWLARR